MLAAFVINYKFFMKHMNEHDQYTKDFYPPYLSDLSRSLEGEFKKQYKCVAL